MKTDIYERVTHQIIAEMEKGYCPWKRTWDVALSLPQRVTVATRGSQFGVVSFDNSMNIEEVALADIKLLEIMAIE